MKKPKIVNRTILIASLLYYMEIFRKILEDGTFVPSLTNIVFELEKKDCGNRGLVFPDDSA